MEEKTKLIIKQTCSTCAVMTAKLFNMKFTKMEDIASVNLVANAYFKWISAEQNDQHRIIRQSQLKAAIELAPNIEDVKNTKDVIKLAETLTNNIING